MKKFNSVKEELLFIGSKHDNFVSPHIVVEFAKNPDTCLHSKFEWNDTKAGHEYRIYQARKIISLELQVVGNEKKQVLTRIFVSLQDDRSPEKGYRLVTDVLADENLRNQFLDEALVELIRIKNKYKSLIELVNIFKAIDKVNEKTEQGR